MSDELATLRERVEKLREALQVIHDRDSQAEPPAGTTDPTVSYTEGIRQHALRALQLDDALAQAHET
jgi:hypothetical protein